MQRELERNEEYQEGNINIQASEEAQREADRDEWLRRSQTTTRRGDRQIRTRPRRWGRGRLQIGTNSLNGISPRMQPIQRQSSTNGQLGQQNQTGPSIQTCSANVVNQDENKDSEKQDENGNGGSGNGDSSNGNGNSDDNHSEDEMFFLVFFFCDYCLYNNIVKHEN